MKKQQNLNFWLKPYVKNVIFENKIYFSKTTFFNKKKQLN